MTQGFRRTCMYGCFYSKKSNYLCGIVKTNEESYFIDDEIMFYIISGEIIFILLVKMWSKRFIVIKYLIIGLLMMRKVN